MNKFGTFVKLNSQLKLGMLAEGYSQLTTVLIQLVVLPVMLYIWGAELYGIWILVSALPAYLSVTNLGFSQVASVDMAKKIGAGNLDEAVLINRANATLNLIVSLAVLFLFSAIFYIFPVNKILNLDHDPSELYTTVVIQAFIVIFTMLFGVTGAAMKATGKFAAMVSATATLRLIDAIVLVAVATQTKSFIAASASLLVFRIACSLPFVVSFYRTHPRMVPYVSISDLKRVKPLFLPSLSYFSYSLSQLMTIQGAVLIAGNILGPSAVVAITAVRTLTRLGRMAAVIINHSIEPILAKLSGTGDKKDFDKHVSQQLIMITILVGVYLLGMLIIGPHFLTWWTHGKIQVDFIFFLLMTLGVALEIYWYTLQTPAIATNTHTRFAVANFLIAAATTASLPILLHSWSTLAVGWTTFVGNALLLIVTLLMTRRSKANS